MRHPRTCALTNGVQQLAHSALLCPLSLPRKNSVAVTLKTKLKRTIFRESLLLYTGAAYISSSKCLCTLAFAARRNYRRVNANTSIGAAILFPGHPYI